ncbi:hypothetical protein ACOTHJ_12580 [Achromobacter xylosoxidans]
MDKSSIQKTIPIACAPAEPAPKARVHWAQQLAQRAVVISVLAGIPALVAYVVMRLYDPTEAFLPSWAVNSGLVVLMMLSMVIGVAKCSPLWGLSAIALGGVSSLAIHLFGLPIVTAITPVAVSLIISLAASHSLHQFFLDGNQTKPGSPTAQELNPRCSTCHARAICPLQPGGIADQYTGK